MKFRLLLIVATTAPGLYSVTAAFSNWLAPENSQPIVTITSPASKNRFEWNSIIPYSISVSDREDGDSRYNEISANEVLLMVTYLEDSSHVKEYLSDMSIKNLEPLVWMARATCFNCHAAKAKLLGPSFEMIAQRYPDTSVSIDSLAKKMLTGTSGTWGELQMPPHPDLKVEKAKEIVSWILKNNVDPDQVYFVGTEGAFRTKEKPTSETGKEAYVITASYSDHGLEGKLQESKRGQHTVVLNRY